MLLAAPDANTWTIVVIESVAGADSTDGNEIVNCDRNFLLYRWGDVRSPRDFATQG